MAANFEKPTDYVKADDFFCHSFLQENQSDGYKQYLAEKMRRQRDHIGWLQTELKYAKNDLTSAWTAVAALLVMLGVVMYQWLVVCNGQAPAGF